MSFDAIGHKIEYRNIMTGHDYGLSFFTKNWRN